MARKEVLDTNYTSMCSGIFYIQIQIAKYILLGDLNCVTNIRVYHLMGRRVKSTYMYPDIPMQAIYNRIITS